MHVEDGCRQQRHKGEQDDPKVSISVLNGLMAKKMETTTDYTGFIWEYMGNI